VALIGVSYAVAEPSVLKLKTTANKVTKRK